MTDTDSRAEWVAVATFGTGLDADMARQLLESADIPVLVRSDAPGIFGSAFQGMVTGGVTLHVPSPVLDQARAVLEGNDDVGGDELIP